MVAHISLTEQARKFLHRVDLDVVVEERGGELEEGEVEKGGGREYREIAEAEDLSFDLGWKER